MWDAPGIEVRVPLTMGERHVILEGLAKLPQGFAREVAERLERTKCKWCHGHGGAPYCGGDDDDAPCRMCNGSGFAT
jgi:hypothetical protein